MIKQSFLDSLAHLSLDEAEKKINAAGHVPYMVDPAAKAITFLTRPNTVIVWNDGKEVTRANAGDGLELDWKN